MINKRKAENYDYKNNKKGKSEEEIHNDEIKYMYRNYKKIKYRN